MHGYHKKPVFYSLFKLTALCALFHEAAAQASTTAGRNEARVLCSATGPAAETCDLCGWSEDKCSGGDCVFNPELADWCGGDSECLQIVVRGLSQGKKTSLCRPHLTNDVRTASVHLQYPANPGRWVVAGDPGGFVPGKVSWFINRIEVVDSASVSYFASNADRFGYGGLLQLTAADADGSFAGI